MPLSLLTCLHHPPHQGLAEREWAKLGAPGAEELVEQHCQESNQLGRFTAVLHVAIGHVAVAGWLLASAFSMACALRGGGR